MKTCMVYNSHLTVPTFNKKRMRDQIKQSHRTQRQERFKGELG